MKEAAEAQMAHWCTGARYLRAAVIWSPNYFEKLFLIAWRLLYIPNFNWMLLCYIYFVLFYFKRCFYCCSADQAKIRAFSYHMILEYKTQENKCLTLS